MESKTTYNEIIYVSMSLKDYSELKEMKDKIEKDFIQVRFTSTYTGDVSITKYYTKDEVIKELKTTLFDIIKKQNIELDNYKTQVKHLKKVETAFNAVKTFSIWDFIKWRRKNKNTNES